MEEIIRNIVDADKQARGRVSAKTKERRNIQNLIQEQSLAIKEKYQKETQERIASAKQAMDADLEEAIRKEDAQYEQALSALQNTYDDHKEEWVKQIVGRIVKV